MLAKIMEPGGGVHLLPFVRLVIVFLMMLTVTAAAVGVARVHMVILSALSAGTLCCCVTTAQVQLRPTGPTTAELDAFGPSFRRGIARASHTSFLSSFIRCVFFVTRRNDEPNRANLRTHARTHART